MMGQSARTYFSWAAIALLVVSLALPIAQLPLVGSINVFGLQDGTAYVLLGAAILAAVAVFLKWYRVLAISGVVVVGMMLIYVYHFYQTMNEAGNALSGNPFGELAKGLLSTAHLEWGIAVIFVAGVALVVASFPTSDAATLPGLFSANRRAFIGGLVGLALVLLFVALAQKIVPAGTVSSASSGRNAAPSDGPSTPEPTASANPAVAKMKGALTVGLLEKNFHKADASNYEFSDSFVVKTQYHNVGTKTISGVKGLLAFYNQFGDRLTGFRIEYEKPLRPGAVAVETARYEYSGYESGDAKLRDTPLKKLRVVWEPEIVNFADGTSLRAPE